MRLPKDSQLSSEQREICLAPCEGTALVTGPPGSGKTVVALIRAQALENKEDDYQFLVFNHVLQRYTDHGATFLTWLSRWWRSSTGSSFPKLNATGRSYFKPYDYAEARAMLRQGLKAQVMTNGHWRHLILDEAQDFPPEAHQLLNYVQSNVFHSLPPDERPSILILADENQQIGSTCSSLMEIRDAFSLGKEDEYSLSRNYRNTKEIALFAKHFCVGLSTGTAELPDARGEKPRLVVTSSLDSAVDRIVKYCEINEEQDVGILVYFEWTRKKIFNKLRHRLQGKGTHVQSYSSNKKQELPAEKLRFESGGSATVLCFASGKGLEFDAVFLPELQTMQVDADNLDHTRMNLYVMTSRARSRLFIMLSDEGKQSDVWGLLPPSKNLYDMED